jgi:hypothetical protein
MSIGIKCPFVDIDVEIHSLENFNSFDGIWDYTTRALWDTGAGMTFVCSDLIELDWVEAGKREFTRIVIKYVQS